MKTSLIKNDVQTAKIVLKQNRYKGESHNVVLDLPGEIDETIVMTVLRFHREHMTICPVAKEMPGNMTERLDIYLCCKRNKK